MRFSDSDRRLNNRIHDTVWLEAQLRFFWGVGCTAATVVPTPWQTRAKCGRGADDRERMADDRSEFSVDSRLIPVANGFVRAKPACPQP